MCKRLLFMSMLLAITFAMPQNYDQLTKFQSNLSDQKNKLIANIGKSVIDVEEGKLRATAAGLRNYGREEARKESETKISQLDSFYANLQKKSSDYLSIKPLVDTISENEKYGNDGGINRVGSIAFVNVYENIANLVNAIFEVPAEKMQRITLKAGEVLRFVGRNLVGL